MKKHVFIIAFTLFSIIVKSQTTDPAIMKINGKEVRKSEFEYIYKKNNNNETVDKKTLQEYLELYKNFKLKVIEAQSLGLDTTPSFKKELNEYRDQLAKTYLSEASYNEDYIKKEYDRLKEYYDISHILVSIPLNKDSLPKLGRQNTVPSDTVAPYKKIMQIHKRLLKGEKFEDIVKKESDDERSASSEKPGNLGWISALMTPASLENAIYTTPEGNISLPARTSFGYHIVKVNKKVSNPGQIRVAHIMVMCTQNAEPAKVEAARQKVDAWYERLQKGENFEELAKTESEDTQTAKAGGDLNWFGLGVMVKEFETAAFELKNTGDISKPIQTPFGFHIIKLLDKKPLESFEEKRAEIVNRLQSNDGYIALRKPGVDELKKEYKFELDPVAYKKLEVAALKKFPTDSTFIATFKDDGSTLFRIGDQTKYTIADFIGFFEKNTQSPFSLSTEFLNERLFSFEITSLLKAENENLENKYPDFKNLMTEYRDGILLFEVSNNEVWDKAGKDTAGLKNYFEQNKQKYTWDRPHYKGYIVHCKDANTMKKMKKEIAKLDPDSAANFLYQNYKVGDVVHVKIEKGLFTQGENPFIDELVYNKGKANPYPEFPVSFTIGNMLNAPSAYTDVKGLVITDYQNYLEKQWVESLNKKYPVEIYQEVVNTIN